MHCRELNVLLICVSIRLWLNCFWFCFCFFLLACSGGLCGCENACGDCLPPVCPASTLSLPQLGPLRLAVQTARPWILCQLPTGQCRRGLSRWVWLPPLLPSCHVLRWAGLDSHACDTLSREISISPKQCHHICAQLCFCQCNQSGVAHDAPQPAEIWCYWQEGKLHLDSVRQHLTSGLRQWSRHSALNGWQMGGTCVIIKELFNKVKSENH